MRMIVRFYTSIQVIIKIFYLLLIVISLLDNHIYSQTDSTSAVTEDIIYDLLQESRVEGDNEDIYLILENLANNPIDLNSANLSELQKIPGLTNYFPLKIIEYKKSFGPFFSLEELLLIEGFSKEMLEQVKPFLIVRPENLTGIATDQHSTKSKWNIFNENVKLNTRSRITNDLQERKGFSEKKFQGSIPRIYNRILLKYSELIDAGLLTEKDAGENSLSEFVSFHFALNNLGLIKTFAAGDYTLEFGQGLALWSPFALSKGTDAIYPIKRKAKRINPYKSTNENNFFRGAALSVNYKSFTVSCFYSNNFFDANIDSVSRKILSTPIDGFHRTDSEISKKKSARETFYGGAIDFTELNNKLNAGILFYNSKFSNSFFQESPFDIGGDNFTYYSIYYDLFLGNINILGESAFDGRSIASLISANFAFNKNFSFITLVRNYPRNYRNIHSYAFGENSGATQNEIGIYTGFQLRTIFGEINFYFDQYKFPYATFENSLPSSGNEFLFDLRSKLTSKIETNVRFNYEKKEVTENFANVKSILNRLRQAVRGEIIYEVSKKLRLRSRLEFNSFKIDHVNINEKGLMAFQDIRYSPFQNISVDARLILFQTDSFNSAIYEYENDLNGILSNVALYGEGMRWYFHIRFKPVKFLSIAVKYSETFKPLEKNLGSGLSEINNNLDNKLGFQLEMSF